MADQEQDLLRQIDDLIDEERALRERSTAHLGLTPTEQSRLAAVEVQLDRCWDLLRQRRARAQYGQSQSEARLRSGDEVESYEG